MFGLIKRLDDDSDTSFIMGVFSIVAIEEGNSLLLILAGQPILNEILYLGDVHKLDVIDVTILLTLDDNIGRDAFVAHGLGVGLVVSAGSVDLIAHT